MPTLSIFSDMSTGPRWILNQCERYDPATSPDVAHEGAWRIVHARRDADAYLCINLPVWPKAIGLMPWWTRTIAKAAGRYHEAKVAHTMRWLGAPVDRTYMLMYEPPPIFARYRGTVPRHLRRLWAPDPTWHDSVRLPVWWTVGATTAMLREEPMPAAADARRRDIPLVIVTGGKSTLPGHVERLEFLRRLRRAGVPIAIYGRNVPEDLRPLGPVADKAEVLRRAHLTLAIENWWADGLYVSEKLWDPLLCWSLPLYFGSRAADAMIPADSFIRLPDLGDAGVEAVRAALRIAPSLRQERLAAVAEARRRMLGEHRLVAWAVKQIEGDRSESIVPASRTPAAEDLHGRTVRV
jgi:hypothetical protein